MEIAQSLSEYIIEQQHHYQDATGELTSVFSSLALAAKIVHREINKAGLGDLTGASTQQNIQGEQQQKLDVFANDRFKSALATRGVVCGLASEEEDEHVSFSGDINNSAKYVVLMDPLDGSSNIDVNVSVGTIFSIYKRISPIGQPVQLEDFLQPGRAQVAAGYIVYGSSTMLVYSSGQGVQGFTYDPSLGSFFHSHKNMTFPQSGNILSINFGLYGSICSNLQTYLLQCIKGENQEQQAMSQRYIGSLVSDFHRNLIKGGLYLYPATHAHPQGKLRLLYECNPIAFLAENAGGLAIAEPNENILDILPTELHQRTPFITGPKNMVLDLKQKLGPVNTN